MIPTTKNCETFNKIRYILRLIYHYFDDHFTFTFCPPPVGITKVTSGHSTVCIPVVTGYH